MNQDIQLRAPDRLPELSNPFGHIDVGAEPPHSIFHKIHQLLRGRYIWAVLLGLAGGAGGALLGYKATQPVYSSSGTIHIKPVVSPVLKQTPETGVMPMFDSFVQAQASLIRSQRVMDMAMDSAEWRALNRPYNDETLREFSESLTITAPPRGEIVMIAFQDEEPRATSAAVKALLDAYNRIYVETSVEAEKAKQKTLDEYRTTLSLQLNSKRTAVQQAAATYGTDDLRSVHKLKMESLSQLEAALSEIEVQLAVAGPGAGAATTQPAAPGDAKKPVELNVREIAARDTRMWQLLQEEQRLRAELEQLVLRDMGDKHPRVIDARSQLAAKSREIEDYAVVARELLAVAGAAAQIGPNQLRGMSVEELRVRQSRLRDMVEAAKTETIRLGRTMLEIEKLRGEETDLVQRLALTDKRIEELTMESPIQGRINIISFGDRPMIAKDNRIQYAGVGGMGGLGLGVGLIMLLGLLDRRMRSPSDAAGGRLMLLGVLPMLPDDLADPEQAAVAAHCVHQIRTLLQISSAGRGHRVFAITSPAAGTGKTSLTLGLGISFAAAESRTLLVDLDILGGGLTARIDKMVRRKIGQILQRQGLVSTQQVEAAVRLGRASHKRLGEMLVELGHLSEEDLLRALDIQEEAPMGVLDVLAGENLEECVADTGIQGLWILPIGAASPSDASKVSLVALRKLIEHAGKHFDTILIDTGPVPGSLEASIASVAADGVVLTLSRGDQRPAAEKCVRHLRDIGAHLAGFVFNRADVHDVDTSSTASRMSVPANGASARVNGARVRAEVVEAGGRPHYGPIGMAVRTGNAPSRNGKSENGKNENGAAS